MNNLTVRQKNLKDFFFNEANKAIQNKDTISFSWEHFWKYDTQLAYYKAAQEEIISIIKDPKDVADRLNNLIYTELRDNDIKFIQKIKLAYYKEFGIKKIKLEDCIPKITTFFKEHRNIDFESLDKEKKYEALRYEDIMSSEIRLYLNLNMSHIQYKFLYQKGSVFN